jgi:hypothetical protein
MLTQILWWGGNALISLLLLRSLTGKFFRKYPIFYVYLSYVLLESLLRFYIYVFHPIAYQTFYWWHTQFIGVTLGYGVIWEIYLQTLASYAGAARMARILLSAVFIAVVIKVLAGSLSGPAWSGPATAADLERNLRTAQAMLLITIVGLLAYYAIPVGRNLRAMLLGYGFYIGASVISLTLRSYLGVNFQLSWQYLQQTIYDVTLAIWCAGLWSYAPNPAPRDEVMLERDYELLAAQTTKLLGQVRAYLMRAVRP